MLRSGCSARRASRSSACSTGSPTGARAGCRASASRRTSKRGMASTEVAREHALGMGHLAGCIALSQAANWNQNAADWRLMLEIGRGYGLTLAAGPLAGQHPYLPLTA